MPDFETRSADWLSPEEALARALTGVEPIEEELLPPENTLGRTLAKPLYAGATLPPWDNSAMDGYAVHAADLAHASEEHPITLEVISEARPGPRSPDVVEPGQAIRIMTGAPIPDGADSVVRVESTDRESTPGTVEISEAVTQGANVRPRGQDMEDGDEVLPAGMVLGSGQLSVVHALGRKEVPVRKRPRVAILASGDELVEVKHFELVRAGEAIPESASWGLVAAVTEAGGDPLRLGIAKDDPESILELLEPAWDADVLITIGGASMGEGDLFKRVLLEQGLELEFWRARIRPGSPLSFGHLPGPVGKRLPVFGLPGNPSSAFVTFHLFAKPYLWTLLGRTSRRLPSIPVVAGEPISSPARLTSYPRLLLRRQGDVVTAFLAGPQSSGLIRPLGQAQALGVIPEGVSEVRPGARLEALLISDFGGFAGQS